MTAVVDSSRVVDRMRIPAGVVTHSMVVVRPVKGHVSVQDARTEFAAVMVHWGEVFMRFTSAAQVHAVLEAFGAARAGLRGAQGTVPSSPAVGDAEWPWVSTLSVTWTRPPEWSVVPQERWDAVQRRTVHWVDVHMGPVLWRVVDWAGYEAALELLRNVHRTSVACFIDGGKFRADPSKAGAVMAEAGI